MKKFLLAALLALPLTVLGQQQVRADNCCSPLYRVGISIGIVYRGWCGCDYGTCKIKKGYGSCKETYCGCLAPSGMSNPCCGGCGGCGGCSGCGGGGGGGMSAMGGEGGGVGGIGPWYGVWPYNAHFQTPAPTGYPYWPAPMTYGGYAAASMPNMANPNYAAAPRPEMGYYGNAMSVMPAQGNFGGYPTAASPVQPASYYQYQTPNYWYGR